MPAAILFDLDGTLVDSAPDLHEALVELLADHGRPPVTVDQVRGMVGHGARLLLRRAWAATGSPAADDEVEALYPAFLERYSPRAARLTRPYPEVEQTLAWLHERHPLALVTNKPEGPTRIVLEALGLARWFGAVVAGDTLPVKKPDPAPLRLALDRLGHEGLAIMVGDSDADVGAAAALGIPSVLVTWGYRHAPVEAHGAHAVIDRFGALPRAIGALARR